MAGKGNGVIQQYGKKTRVYDLKLKKYTKGKGKEKIEGGLTNVTDARTRRRPLNCSLTLISVR